MTHDFLSARELCGVANGRRVGEFPQDVIGDQRLPLGGVIDERLDVSLQEVGGNC